VFDAPLTQLRQQLAKRHAQSGGGLAPLPWGAPKF